MPRGRKRQDWSSWNLILRDSEQVLLFNACRNRLSEARGGVKVSAIHAVLEMCRLYLDFADRIDPVTDAMRELAKQRSEEETE